MYKFILVIIICFPLCLIGEVYNLKNEDRISGSIISTNNGILTITNSLIGLLKIPENQIKIPTKNSIIQKKISPWSGQISASILNRDSNTLQKKSDGSVQEKDQIIDNSKIQLQINYKQNFNEFKWIAKYKFYKTDIRKIDDQSTLIQEYKRVFTGKKYFLLIRSMYQQDYRRAIDHEYLQTFEIGTDWIKNDNIRFSTSLGPAYHRYFRTAIDSTTTENIDRDVELPKVVFTENFRWELIDDLAIIQQYRHQGDLSNYQILLSIGIENRLISNTFLKLEYKVEEDTEVSYDDRAYYNRSLLASIIYKF